MITNRGSPLPRPRQPLSALKQTGSCESLPRLLLSDSRRNSTDNMARFMMPKKARSEMSLRNLPVSPVRAASLARSKKSTPKSIRECIESATKMLTSFASESVGENIRPATPPSPGATSPRSTNFPPSPQPELFKGFLFEPVEPVQIRPVAPPPMMQSSDPLSPVARSELNKRRSVRLADEQRDLEMTSKKNSLQSTVACVSSATQPPSPIAPLQRAPLSRAELHRMRVARVHAEEAELYAADSRAIKHGKLPASTSAHVREAIAAVVFETSESASDARPAVLDRRALQRMRASRVHEEEAELYLLDAKNTIGAIGEGADRSADMHTLIPDRAALQRMRAERAHAEESELAGADGSVAGAIEPTTIEPQMVDRIALNRMRAARAHDEEVELDLALAANFLSNDLPSSLEGPPAVLDRNELQRIRAARLHSEERELYEREQTMTNAQISVPGYQTFLRGRRAARLHDEERELEAAAAGEPHHLNKWSDSPVRTLSAGSAFTASDA